VKARALLAVAALAAGGLVGVWLNRERLMLIMLAAHVEQTMLAERAALIEPHMQFLPPAGPPPYPAVLQFHGCGGMRQSFMARWADVAREAGYMAVIVDSYAPRGITAERALSSVCAGKELIGQERAGDALAALDIVRKRSDVDPSRLVLAGWSHGAWSAMDLLARAPAGVKDPDRPRVAGAILFYPYCGRGAWSRLADWRRPPQTLAFIPTSDTIVAADECLDVLERLKSRGAPIDIRAYEGVDHAFDDPDHPPEWIRFYNAEAHADAVRRYRDFLRTIAAL
jgi:dienelactone hydrolase